MAEEELSPDMYDWIRSQEFTDRYNTYVTASIEREKEIEERKKIRNLELEAEQERARILREEYEASPAYKIELEVKKLKEERSTYIKRYIQPLHNALIEMGAVCNSDECDCNDDHDWDY